MRDIFIKYCDQVIQICLYFIIFCLPFAKAGVEIFTWMAIFLWLIKRLLGFRIQGKSGIFSSTELNKALAIFVIVNVIAVVMSCSLGLSVRAFFGKILKFVMLFFIVVETVNDKKRLRNVMLVMIISASFMIADGGVQYFRGKDFLRGFPYERLRASFPSANGYGGWLVVYIPLFLGLIMAGHPKMIKTKILLGALVISLGVSLLLTFSRGAWLGVIVGLVLFSGCIFKSRYMKFKISTPVLVAICSVTVFLVLPHVIKERIKSMRDIGHNSNRITLWRESLSIIEDFPVVGSGLNTYSIVARNYKIAEGGGVYPHNSYLQMAAETGLPGLASFFWVLFVFFRTGLRYYNKSRDYLLLGLLSGILAFLVQAFFDTHLYSLQLVVLFWFMLGLSVAVMKLGTDAKNV